MKKISLKIDEVIFTETEKILNGKKISRNKHINEAIKFNNNYQRKKLIEKNLKFESEQVRGDSMEVLREFEQIDNAD